MKVLFKLVITLFLIVSIANTANANDRGVNGIIIGSGAGAIMGQAVGRNVESTIIGATVGGIIGAVIGAESSHRYQEKIIVHKPSRRQHNRHFNHTPRSYSPRFTHNRPHSRGHNYHRDTFVIHKQHDGRRKGYYNKSRPQNKHHYSSHKRYRRPFKDNNRW
jgi:uncharacterized protein YcfJ